MGIENQMYPPVNSPQYQQPGPTIPGYQSQFNGFNAPGLNINANTTLKPEDGLKLMESQATNSLYGMLGSIGGKILDATFGFITGLAQIGVVNKAYQTQLDIDNNRRAVAEKQLGVQLTAIDAAKEMQTEVLDTQEEIARIQANAQRQIASVQENAKTDRASILAASEAFSTRSEPDYGTPWMS